LREQNASSSATPNSISAVDESCITSQGESDRDDLPWLQRRCELTCDCIPDGEVARVDAALDEREQVDVEVESPIVAVHVDNTVRPVVRLNGRDAHRPILPRAVQSKA
jgi:hypothetical protein